MKYINNKNKAKSDEWQVAIRVQREKSYREKPRRENATYECNKGQQTRIYTHTHQKKNTKNSNMQVFDVNIQTVIALRLAMPWNYIFKFQFVSPKVRGLYYTFLLPVHILPISMRK